MSSNKPIPSRSREIPDKLYFRIGEVSRLCGVAASVLRFWETEFSHLKPNKGGTGQRLYRRRDVEAVLRIKQLLYDEGYTIAGARQVFKAELKQPTPMLALGLDAAGVPPLELKKSLDIRKLKRLRRELEELRMLLVKPLAAAQATKFMTHQAAPSDMPPPGSMTVVTLKTVANDAAQSIAESCPDRFIPLISDEEIHRLFDEPKAGDH